MDQRAFYTGHRQHKHRNLDESTIDHVLLSSKVLYGGQKGNYQRKLGGGKSHQVLVDKNANIT